jgi:hypothetical protein
MSNRFYEVGWDVEHLLKVVSKILGALVVVSKIYEVRWDVEHLYVARLNDF